MNLLRLRTEMKSNNFLEVFKSVDLLTPNVSRFICCNHSFHFFLWSAVPSPEGMRHWESKKTKSCHLQRVDYDLFSDISHLWPPDTFGKSIKEGPYFCESKD